MLKLGEKAPEFCLPDRNAQKVYLSNFFRKWVVVYFYPKDGSAGCTQEAIDFSSLLTKFEELNAVVIGISPDSVKSHYDFCAKNNLQMLLLSDRTQKVMQQYGAYRVRKIYGQDKTALVRCTYIINPGGVVAAEWDNVHVGGHAQTVLDTLKDLKKKK